MHHSSFWENMEKNEKLKIHFYGFRIFLLKCTYLNFLELWHSNFEKKFFGSEWVTNQMHRNDVANDDKIQYVYGLA